MKTEKEILTFQVNITGMDTVKGSTGEVEMIHFDGDCDCPLFKGKVLPGGIDTQRQYVGECRTLSARYILEGVDANGQQCRIFVENNAVMDEDGQIAYTHPRILTNSQALAFLETADLKGTISPRENGVQIHILNVI